MIGTWRLAERSWSRELRNLRDDLVDLDELFLSFAAGRPIPTANTKEERLRLEAFIVLAHAHVERYLEDLVLGLVDEIERMAAAAVDVTGIPAAVTIVWNCPEPGAPRRRLQPADLRLVRESLARHRKAVRGNNGIKATNLGRLIEPLGLAVADVGSLLGGELTEAGKGRGEVAHGASVGATTAPNVADEVSRYVRIVQELPRLEALLLSVL